jgi:hypothetical protein
MAVEETHPLAEVPQAPSDVMFGLSAAYRADDSPEMALHYFPPANTDGASKAHRTPGGARKW